MTSLAAVEAWCLRLSAALRVDCMVSGFAADAQRLLQERLISGGAWTRARPQGAGAACPHI